MPDATVTRADPPAGAIAEAIADQEAALWRLEEEEAAARATADQADAALVEAQAADALAGGVSARNAGDASATADAARLELARIEGRRRTTAAVIERLRARHQAARLSEMASEQDGLAAEWEAAVAGLRAISMAWEGGWRRLWELRERDHALLAARRSLEAGHSVYTESGGAGHRLVCAWDAEPIPIVALERSIDALYALDLKVPASPIEPGGA